MFIAVTTNLKWEVYRKLLLLEFFIIANCPKIVVPSSSNGSPGPLHHRTLSNFVSCCWQQVAMAEVNYLNWQGFPYLDTGDLRDVRRELNA